MITVLHGDCREILPTLEAESVHCVVTSPPYYGLRDYGVEGQIGLESSPDEYIQTLVEVFREVRRVLRKDGTVWLNLGDSYNNRSVARPSSHQGGLGFKNQSINASWAEHTKAGLTRLSIINGQLKEKDLLMIPARVALALQGDGWWLRSDIIWHKPNPMPESVTDRPTSSHEHVFLLSKAQRYFYDAEAVREAPTWAPQTGTKTNANRTRNVGGRDDGYTRISEGGGVGCPEGGRNLRNVWTITTQPFPQAHFATFPAELAERCIKAGTSEKGACGECGAPCVRQVEKEFTPQTDVSAERGIREAHQHDASSGWPGSPRGTTNGKTLGWSPSCQCNAETIPCTVLDPFGGAGTVGLVADRLQRSTILIELNGDYVNMSRQRIRNDAPLFA